jgi:hypothetical protein
MPQIDTWYLLMVDFSLDQALPIVVQGTMPKNSEFPESLGQPEGEHPQFREGLVGKPLLPGWKKKAGEATPQEIARILADWLYDHMDPRTYLLRLDRQDRLEIQEIIATFEGIANRRITTSQPSLLPKLKKLVMTAEHEILPLVESGKADQNDISEVFCVWEDFFSLAISAGLTAEPAGTPLFRDRASEIERKR